MQILLALALIPPLFLMKKVYDLDKIEKEPTKLLILLFLLGALSCLPAAFVEVFLGNALSSLINPAAVLYIIIDNMIIVAGAEELCKYLILKKVTWKHPAFDYRFDAVVYAAAATLGFAALENVLYVISGGIATGLMRAVLSIPGHCIFGIYMGYYYGLAKQFDMQGDRKKARRNLRKALFMPMLLHGFYDLCLSLNNNIMYLLFFVYVIILDIITIRNIKKMSRTDIPLVHPETFRSGSIPPEMMEPDVTRTADFTQADFTQEDNNPYL